MHYHSEIVIPPTSDIEEAVRAVLAPFNEKADDEEDRKHAFWDWWVIGGRWAGAKAVAKYDPTQLQAFNDWAESQQLTVEGFQTGKPGLKPASQVEKVDAKWNEMFPSEPPMPCPLFAHSNDQYGTGLEGTLPEDVQEFGDVSPRLTCERVIFAASSYDGVSESWTGLISANFLLSQECWNGQNYQRTTWDGTFGAAQALYTKYLERYSHNPQYLAACTPTKDWLVVTVDYHS